jgi:predicted nucleotidyltransferase
MELSFSASRVNLSTAQLQRYITSAQERERDRLAKLEERRRSALSLAKQAASLLKEEFGATQVILFGSLLTETFHETSDIDLAVIGLPEHQYFQAVGRLLGLGDFDFDLVEVQNARPEMAQAISQGVIL